MNHQIFGLCWLALIGIVGAEVPFKIIEKDSLKLFPGLDLQELGLELPEDLTKFKYHKTFFQDLEILDLQMEYLEILNNNADYTINEAKHAIDFEIKSELWFGATFYFVYNFLFFPFSGYGQISGKSTGATFAFTIDGDSPSNPSFFTSWDFDEVTLDSSVAMVFKINKKVTEAFENEFTLNQAIQKKFEKDLPNIYSKRYSNEKGRITFPYLSGSTPTEFNRTFKSFTLGANVLFANHTENLASQNSLQVEPYIPLPEIFTRGYWQEYSGIKDIYTLQLAALQNLVITDSLLPNTTLERLDTVSFERILPDIVLVYPEAQNINMTISGVKDAPIEITPNVDSNTLTISGLDYIFQFIVVDNEAEILNAEGVFSFEVTPTPSIVKYDTSTVGVQLIFVLTSGSMTSVKSITSTFKTVLEEGFMEYMNNLIANAFIPILTTKGWGETLTLNENLSVLLEDQDIYMELGNDGILMYTSSK